MVIILRNSLSIIFGFISGIGSFFDPMPFFVGRFQICCLEASYRFFGDCLK